MNSAQRSIEGLWRRATAEGLLCSNAKFAVCCPSRVHLARAAVANCEPIFPSPSMTTTLSPRRFQVWKTLRIRGTNLRARSGLPRRCPPFLQALNRLVRCRLAIKVNQTPSSPICCSVSEALPTVCRSPALARLWSRHQASHRPRSCRLL